MKRCAICDYTHEGGSSYLNIPSDGRKVKWNPIHHEFQCTVCLSEIKKQFHNKDLEEFNKYIEGDFDSEEDQMVEYYSSLSKPKV